MSKTEILRELFGKIQSVNPDGKAYSDLCAFLGARSNKELEDLAAANIKWISSLSRNRLALRKGWRVRS